MKLSTCTWENIAEESPFLGGVTYSESSHELMANCRWVYTTDCGGLPGFRVEHHKATQPAEPDKHSGDPDCAGDL